MANNKINVLHINCNYVGTKLHQTMIETLNQYTNNVVFCPVISSLNESDANLYSSDKVIISKCFNKFDRFFFFKKQKKILNNLVSNVDIKQFHCVHAYTLFTDGNCALEINKRYGIPYVVAVRATDFSFFKYRINIRKKAVEILDNASKIFFLSEKKRDIFLNNYLSKMNKNSLLNKIEIIPNGINDYWLDNSFKEKDILSTEEKFNDKNLNIITVSQIIKRKNIPIVQNVIENMIKHGWSISYEVIGKGIDKKILKKICRKDYTNFFDHMTKEQLIQHYRWADIFVLPSINETFGLVYAEAMTQGLPVLYTNNEGFDGQFKEGMVGYSINPKYLNDIENKILLCIKNYKNLYFNEMKNIHKFKWSIIVRKYFKIYKSVVGDSIEN